MSCLSATSLAQETVRKKSGPRRQLATIVFAGLGGAILGLSTLSFYGRPQDKLSNIAIGFAVGVISGTVYVTFKSAKEPSTYYGDDKAVEYRLAPPAESTLESVESSSIAFAPYYFPNSEQKSHEMGGALRLSF
jgi:hypothetical protein